MLDQPHLAAAPAAHAYGPAANDPAPQALRLTFTGSGAEYFRIWVVNLLLSLATLGIYSAWAKVRRLQYFDRNTQLAGATFDFRGAPKAVLRGRLLAVVLLGGYHYAFGFSETVGLAMIAGLLLALPFLMRSALRFRLRNTYYRGLPFGFCGSVPGAYRAYLPPIATFLLPGVAMALVPESWLSGAAFLPYLGWPLMHAAMKRYQHAHLLYGGEQSSYEIRARRFWRPYLMSGLLCLVPVIVALGVFAAITAVSDTPPAVPFTSGWRSWISTLLFIALPVFVFYLATGPYVQVRVANLAWSNTAFRGLQIQSDLKARAFMKLQTVNAVLTLLTLGLYRPFAVVRVYRYRLAHLALLAVDGDFERLADSTAPAQAGAAGDGVADFMGVDLSW